MALSQVVAFGKLGTLFQDNASLAGVDVGSASDRVAYVWMGNLADTTVTPSSVTVGSDTLSSSQAQFTTDGNYKWRLYYGALTVTGSQTITATGSSNIGQVAFVGVVYSGVDAALLESYQVDSITVNNSFTSATVTSSTGDVVVGLVSTSANTETFTASGDTSKATGTGIGNGEYFFVLTEPGAASVTLTGDTADIAAWDYVAFNVPAGSADATFTGTTITSAASIVAGSAVATKVITTDPICNNSGTTLTATTVDKIVCVKLSDLTLVCTWTSQTTDGSGVLSLTHASLVAGTNYLLTGADTTGTNTFSGVYQAY